MTVFGVSSAPWTGSLRIAVPLLLAALSVYLLLPRPRRRQVLLGAVCGIAALILGGFTLLHVDGSFSAETFLFFAFSCLSALGGVMLITQRNPARAAISFALVVMSVCGLFLLQAAPFLMAASIIIYAGAIIVTFLFVLMLAQQVGFSDADDRTREPFTAALATFVLLGALLLLLDHTFPDPRQFGALLDRMARAERQESAAEIRSDLGDPESLVRELRRETRHIRGSAYGALWDDAATDLEAELGNDRAATESLQQSLHRLVEAGRGIQRQNRGAALPADNVAALGRLLFSDHILAVELGGTLLLVATIGAIAITHRRSEGSA
jgi:NADH:ubiquinone oxidoreductase subunit 6 (subunit J)